MVLSDESVISAMSFPLRGNVNMVVFALILSKASSVSADHSSFVRTRFLHRPIIFCRGSSLAAACGRNLLKKFMTPSRVCKPCTYTGLFRLMMASTLRYIGLIAFAVIIYTKNSTSDWPN